MNIKAYQRDIKRCKEATGKTWDPIYNWTARWPDAKLHWIETKFFVRVCLTIWVLPVHLINL